MFQMERAGAPGERITARARPQMGHEEMDPKPRRGTVPASVEERSVTQTMVAFLGQTPGAGGARREKGDAISRSSLPGESGELEGRPQSPSPLLLPSTPSASSRDRSSATGLETLLLAVPRQARGRDSQATYT